VEIAETHKWIVEGSNNASGRGRAAKVWKSLQEIALFEMGGDRLQKSKRNSEYQNMNTKFQEDEKVLFICIAGRS